MAYSLVSEFLLRICVSALSRPAWAQPVLSVLCATVLGACAPLQPAALISVADMAATAPPALRPADSERALFAWNAIGSQIYECRVNEKGGVAWTFVAPEAELFNQDNDRVGTHGAGPFWAANDGSRITGTLRARADGARPADIPLLLLSTQAGEAAGMMAGVTSVQRLNTHGGNPPARGCESQADAGKRIKQGYTADYVFFAARPA